LKKNDFTLMIIYLFQFICLVLILLAVRFEMANKPNMFVLFSGIFMVLIGVIIALNTKMKWIDEKKRNQK